MQLKTAVVSASKLHRSDKRFGERSLLARDYVSWPTMPPDVAEEVAKLKKKKESLFRQARNVRARERRLRDKYKQRGFTILELLIVLCILGILVALVLGVWNGVHECPETQKVHSPVLWRPLSIVCLDGHEYLYSGWPKHAVLAPRFNEEGKPRKCRAERTK